ncbi:MAG: hypothetical protein FJ242_06735 [Nitrospira sp.]|nr:hypothetical protein [Nitrospira sp.]
MYNAAEDINDNFIGKWHPKYDETEDDEPEYKRLVGKVRSEIESNGSLTKETFVDILNWKAARVKGRVDWQNVDRYLDATKRCREIEDMEKMRVLIDLQGIGVPVASTILHFIYPQSFPIIDQRTVDVLKHFGYIQHKSRDLKRYPAFKEAILLLKQRYPRWFLGEIDRAMFAYHKQNPDLFGKLTKAGKCCKNATNPSRNKLKGTVVLSH